MTAAAGFKDHFSDQAADYRRFRPAYPRPLFSYLAELAPVRRLAWDCATGSGQVARGIAPFFSVVVATDASVAQLGEAVAHPRVVYRAGRAEIPPFADASVDLVTVAQALHWFDAEKFFAGVRRVLSPDGLVAVWSYNLLSVTPAVDSVIRDLYTATLAEYWPPERRLVEKGYAGIPFPFEALDAPAFSMTAQWRCRDLLGYLRTWSAVHAFHKASGADPVGVVASDIEAAWGQESVRLVSWPLKLKLGRQVS